MKVDSVVIERVESFAEFKSFIKTLGISDRVFVIKPCWQDAKYYTSAETLEWLLKSLKGKK